MCKADEKTISFTTANLWGVILFIPITAVYALLFEALWGLSVAGKSLIVLKEHYFLIFGIIIAAIFLHELMHGLVLKYAGKKSWHAIVFGFNLKGISPYVHCREPVHIWAYRWGIITPGIILGILPFGLSLFTANALLAWFGYLFTISAAGDFIILWLIRNVDSDKLVQDHPTRVGCTIIHNTTNSITET